MCNIVVLLAYALLIQPGPMTKPLPGMWSASGAYLWPGATVFDNFPEHGRAITLRSPDSSVTLAVDDTGITVRIAHHSGYVTRRLGIQSLSEVLWAPDSRAFAVTQSDGGWVGTWYVEVYLISDTSLQRAKVTDRAFEDFSRRKVTRKRPCEVEAPNLGALTWSQSSKRLLIIAEAPPHSSCCDMGRIHGYMVDVPTGTIIARYSLTDLVKLYQAKFGWRFAP